jgi:antitoxin VapB
MCSTPSCSSARHRRDDDSRRHLRERLDKIERRCARARVEELLAIADRAAAHVKCFYLDHAELLCDHRGLPK